MTAPVGEVRARRLAMWVLGGIVAMAATVGAIGYSRHVEALDRERRQFAETVCHRQDQVIDVLRLIASDERARLAWPDVGDGIFRSNVLIRREIDRILASPCNGKGQ